MRRYPEVRQYAIYSRDPIELQIPFQVHKICMAKCERTISNFFRLPPCIVILVKSNQLSGFQMLQYFYTVPSSSECCVNINSVRINLQCFDALLQHYWPVIAVSFELRAASHGVSTVRIKLCSIFCSWSISLSKFSIKAFSPMPIISTIKTWVSSS